MSNFPSRSSFSAIFIIFSDEILKAAEKNPSVLGVSQQSRPGPAQPQGISLRDPGPASPPGPGSAHGLQQPHQQQQPVTQRPMQQLPQTGVPFQQRFPPPGQGPVPPPGPIPPQSHPQQINPVGGGPRYAPTGLQSPIGPGQPLPGVNSSHPIINGLPPQSFNPPPPQGFNGQPSQGPPLQNFGGPPGQGPSHFGPVPNDPQFTGNFVSQGRPAGNYPGPVQPRRF